MKINGEYKEKEMIGRTLAVERDIKVKIDTTEKKYYDFTMKTIEKNAEILEVIKNNVPEEDIFFFGYK